MPTKVVNARSKKMQARVSHEIINEMEGVKEIGESDAQFIVTSMQTEIKRRLRKRAKQEPQS
ncbi:MAG: YlcI/YnfO family protein [Sodalis sp. (in: enterobacteria)]|uniref:YlcI/YnfO family protein n=1 Tax=Sodalis sp. (in: enterobacteria) TaxID=1898979 RepID=UPI0039E4A1FD